MSKRRKCCCPFKIQSWFALAFFLFCAFFMAVLQLYPDTIPEYPEECQNLEDLGFKLIPRFSSDYSSIADILVLIAIGVFIIMVSLKLVETPQLAIRRWLFLLAMLYMLRGLAVIDTRYPKSPFAITRYTPPNFVVGGINIMLGIHATATDFMFSGHTVNFTLALSFVARYTNYGVFSNFFSAFCVFGMLSLIAVREHYSSDVFVGFIITKLAFWAYHLFFDTKYKRFWVSGVEIIDTGPGVITRPFDMAGIKVTKDMIRSGRNLNPIPNNKRALFGVLCWLDGE